jgi:hypothetical protein
MNDNMDFGEFMDMYESCMDLGAAECILFGFGFHQIIFSLSSLAEAILTEGFGCQKSLPLLRGIVLFYKIYQGMVITLTIGYTC